MDGEAVLHSHVTDGSEVFHLSLLDLVLCLSRWLDPALNLGRGSNDGCRRARQEAGLEKELVKVHRGKIGLDRLVLLAKRLKEVLTHHITVLQHVSYNDDATRPGNAGELVDGGHAVNGGHLAEHV